MKLNDREGGEDVGGVGGAENTIKIHEILKE